MARWVMKHEIEGDLGVETELPQLVFKHPAGQYEVHLENGDMRPGCDLPLLTAHTIFDAPTIEDAELKGERLISHFLDLLAFSTGSRFQVHRTFCLMDWSDGVEERKGYVYGSFPNPELPQLVLNHKLAPMLELLASADGHRELSAALHWFAAGVAERFPDQQFQFFWFAIETLARLTNAKVKVADRCAKCHEPLYCPKCNEVTTHRPYPSQAIEQVFHRFIVDEPERAFAAASSTRHAMLHAESLDDVEEKNGLTVQQLVDIVGRLAWVVLLDAVVARSPKQGKVHVQGIEPSTFLHHRAGLKLCVNMPTTRDREPSFTDLPNPESFKLRLIVQDEPQDPRPQKASATSAEEGPDASQR